MKSITFEPPTFQQQLRQDERRASRAAFYAVYLRDCLKLPKDERAYWVEQRYPGVRIPEHLLKQPEEPAARTA